MAKLGSEQRARKVREIYLSLPDTEETPTWGSPHFRVAGKIFGGLGEHDGRTTISAKLEMDHADALVHGDPRFSRAAYVGHKGWVSIDVTDVEDWEEIRLLVHESYRLIAPKRSYAKLAASNAAPATARKPASTKARPTGTRATKPTATKATARKSTAAKPTARPKAKDPSATNKRSATKPSATKPGATKHSTKRR